MLLAFILIGSLIAGIYMIFLFIQAGVTAHREVAQERKEAELRKEQTKNKNYYRNQKETTFRS